MKEKEYIVALAIDDNAGNVDYCNKEVIEANSKKSAETKYNKKKWMRLLTWSMFRSTL